MAKSKAICILGMHRSGTSVITRAVNLLGAYIGEVDQLLPPGKDNPKGFWEHQRIVQIHDQILNMLSQTWDTTLPLPKKWWKHPKIHPFKMELAKIVQQQFARISLWAWKDPRTCLLLPLWKEILAEMNIELNYIIVVRNPLDVAVSLRKRDGFSKQKSLAIWNLYTLTALYESQYANRAVIYYDHFLQDWELQLKRVAHSLAIKWPKREDRLREYMADLIEPGLRHNQTSFKQLNKDQAVPREVVSAFQICLKSTREPSYIHSQDCRQKIFHLYHTSLLKKTERRN